MRALRGVGFDWKLFTSFAIPFSIIFKMSLIQVVVVEPRVEPFVYFAFLFFMAIAKIKIKVKLCHINNSLISRELFFLPN